MSAAAYQNSKLKVALRFPKKTSILEEAIRRSMVDVTPPDTPPTFTSSSTPTPPAPFVPTTSASGSASGSSRLPSIFSPSYVPPNPLSPIKSPSFPKSKTSSMSTAPSFQPPLSPKSSPLYELLKPDLLHTSLKLSTPASATLPSASDSSTSTADETLIFFPPSEPKITSINTAPSESYCSYTFTKGAKKGEKCGRPRVISKSVCSLHMPRAQSTASQPTTLQTLKTLRINRLKRGKRYFFARTGDRSKVILRCNDVLYILKLPCAMINPDPPTKRHYLIRSSSGIGEWRLAPMSITST